MSCQVTLSGIAKDCNPNMGGLRSVRIASWNAEDITSAGDGEASISNSEDFFEYEFPRGTASMTSTATINPQNGHKSFTTEIAMQFNRMDLEKRNELMKLLRGDLMVIATDENGEQWIPSITEPMNVSAMDGTIEAALDGANKFGVTLQVQSAELPYLLVQA